MPLTRPHLFILLSLILFLGLAPTPAQAEAVVSKKIGALVEQLDSNYKERRAGERPALAVLPLSVSADLAKKNVGFAFSELLTHKFSRRGGFEIVERSQINSVLAEQKFQQTGAVDTASASEIGKMLGASLIVVGSVEQVGRNYQVNTRLVEVESSRVAATAYEEIPAHLFESEAQPYLTLVAPTQTLGVYALAHFGGKTDGGRIASSGADRLEIKDFDANFYGAGLRYFPTRRLFFDVAGMVPMRNENVGTLTRSGSPSFTQITEYNLQSSKVLRAFAGYVFLSRPLINAHAGLGVIHYDLFADSGGADKDFNLEETAVFTRLGAEWRPQQRFGLSLSVMANLGQPQGTVEGFGDAQKLNRISFEPGMNFYF